MRETCCEIFLCMVNGFLLLTMPTPCTLLHHNAIRKKKFALLTHIFKAWNFQHSARTFTLFFYLLLRHGSCVYGNFLLETCSCVCRPVSEIFYHSKCFCVTTLKSERERDFFFGELYHAFPCVARFWNSGRLWQLRGCCVCLTTFTHNSDARSCICGVD